MAVGKNGGEELEMSIKEEEIDILFEFKGYRKAFKVKHSSICLCIQQHLRFLGETEATVKVVQCEPEGSEQSTPTFLIQKWSKKWNAFVNVSSVFEILSEDKVTVTRKPMSSPTQAKSPYERASSIMERVKKPTEIEARALAKCFPSSKRKTGTFDPNAECVVASAQSKKKAAFKKKERSVCANVVMLKYYLPYIPKGTLRKELMSKGRIKNVSVTRNMSNLQVKNIILQTFKVECFTFLESGKNGRLASVDGNLLTGDYAVNRRGSIYLCEIDDSEITTEPARKKPKNTMDLSAHCSKDLAQCNRKEIVNLCSDVESGNEAHSNDYVAESQQTTNKQDEAYQQWLEAEEVEPRASAEKELTEMALGDTYVTESRQIRKEQDEAYQQCLEADKAKDRARAEREQVEKMKVDLRCKWPSDRLNQLEGMKFTIRFSDSTKVECHVQPLASSKVLYEIAVGHGNITKGFNLFSISPRELVSISARVKDISSSVLVAEERDDGPDLLTFVRINLSGLSEEVSLVEQTTEVVQDGSDIVQKVNEKRRTFMSTCLNVDKGIEREFHRENLYEEVIEAYQDDLEAMLKEFPFRVRYSNELAVDTGGVCRDLFSAFWEDSYVKNFDGEKLLVPAVRPNTDMNVLRTLGTILSHGFMVCAFLPIRIAFPVIAAVLLGPDIPFTNDIILDSFIDYLATYESSLIQESLRQVENSNELSSTLQRQIISTFSRMGCVQVPTKSNLKELLVSTARHIFVGKPLGMLYTIYSGVPKHFSGFFKRMTMSELFILYKSLGANSEKVLNLIDEPDDMNSAEERVFSYLTTFISNSKEDVLQLFLRFVTGSSVILDEKIQVCFNNSDGLARAPTTKTFSCSIELPLSYTSYPEFEQELSKILSSESVWVMDTI